MADTATFILQLKDLVSGPASRATKSLLGIRQGLSETDKSMGRFIDKTGRMREANGRFVAGMGDMNKSLFGSVTAGNLAADALRKVKEYATQLIVGSGRAAYDVSRLANALRAVSDGEDGKRLLAELSDMAVHFGLNASDTAEGYISLMRAGFGDQMSKDLIKLGADMQAVGGTAEKTKNLFLALSQIKSTGYLQGDELNQLAEAGVNRSELYDQIAKQMNVDPSEVNKLKEAGKLSADVVIKAVMDAQRSRYGELGSVAEANAKTTQGVMDRISASMEQARLAYGASVDRGVEAGSSSGGLLALFTNPKVVKMIDQVGYAFGVVASGVGELAAVFTSQFAEVFSQVMTNFSYSGYDAASFGDVIKALIPIIKGVAFALGLVVSGLVVLFRMFTEGVPKLAEAGAQLIAGLWQGITSKWEWLKEKILGLGASVVGWAKQALGIASPSKEFAYLGEMSAAGFNEGLASEIDASVPAPSLGSGYSRAAATMGQRGGVTMGNITIQVTSTDPDKAGQSVLEAFEAKFASLVGGYAAEVGA